MKGLGEDPRGASSPEGSHRPGHETVAQPSNLSALASRCGEGLRSLGLAEVQIAFTVLRAMAEGLDVTSSVVAGRAGHSEAFVERVLGRWPASEVNPAGIVVGFWGISKKQTPHKVMIERTTLFGWCAWDSLLLPALLGSDARIESTCPVTSKKVLLDLAGEQLRDVEPPEAVMSFVEPGCIDGGTEVYESFCQHVHFLATYDGAQKWLNRRRQPGYLLSLHQAWELARRVVGLLPDVR